MDNTLTKQYAGCALCPFGAWANKVHYRGHEHPDLLFIGEASGKVEDAVGQPFLGRAGRLLDSALETTGFKTAGLTWGITNALLCRPSEQAGGANRTPTRLEVENCNPRLAAMVSLVAPRVGFVVLGRVAERALLLVRNRQPINKPVWYNHHPAYVLRNPSALESWHNEFRRVVYHATGRKPDPVKDMAAMSKESPVHAQRVETHPA